MSDQASTIAPYKGGTGGDGNIMPLHIYKKLFPRATKEQLLVGKNNNIQLKIYIKTTITQFGMCKVRLQHSDKQKICKFFMVPRNGQALLGMPVINMQNMIAIKFSTVDTPVADQGGTMGAMAPSPNFAAFTYENMYQTRPLLPSP